MPPRERTCAIIGLSDISSSSSAPSLTPGRHPLPYSHAPAIASIPGLRVAAICDLDQAAIARFEERWGDTWPGMTTYTDAFELIARESPDILAVVTPDHLHADIVIAAAERGIPGIMCEKPLATSLTDADRMIAACREHGTRITVNHTRRWDPFFHQAKLLIDAGRIGEVITVSGTVHGPRAMLYRNGTHIIDLMHHYAGSRPVRVSGWLESGFDDFTEYRGDGGREPSSEPAAMATIEYESGARGQYNGMKGPRFMLVDWDVIGTQGRLRIGGTHAELRVWSDEQQALVEVPFPASIWMTGGVQAAWEELLASLDDPAILLRSDAKNARDNVATIDAILRSHQRGGAFVDLR